MQSIDAFQIPAWVTAKTFTPQVKVTGASFLVFSGALKSNSGYTAKSSIVEDGILVQIGPLEMAKLKQAIHAMENYRIVCKETKVCHGDLPRTYSYLKYDGNTSWNLLRAN